MLNQFTGPQPPGRPLQGPSLATMTCCKACLLSVVHLFGQPILSVYELPRAISCLAPMWVCSKLLPYEFLTRWFLCSSRFYGALLGTVCVLYLLPLCWVFALLNSTLFLGNVEFFRGKAWRA